MSGFTLDLEHFRARVLQDAMNEATAIYYLGRARDLAKALHRPGDYAGQRTPEQLAEHNERIVAALISIRQHVAMLRGEAPRDIPLKTPTEYGSGAGCIPFFSGITEEVRAVLSEVA